MAARHAATNPTRRPGVPGAMAGNLPQDVSAASQIPPEIWSFERFRGNVTGQIRVSVNRGQTTTSSQKSCVVNELPHTAVSKRLPPPAPAFALCQAQLA